MTDFPSDHRIYPGTWATRRAARSTTRRRIGMAGGLALRLEQAKLGAVGLGDGDFFLGLALGAFVALAGNSTPAVL